VPGCSGEGACAVGPEGLVGRDRVVESPVVEVGTTEVVARGQSVEVLDARDALVVGKQRLEGRDRVASAASIDVGIAERVAGDECVAVVGAEDPLAVGEQRVDDRDCLADPPSFDIRVETSPPSNPRSAGVERRVDDGWPAVEGGRSGCVRGGEGGH
jgi:hypothetical protein